MSLIPTPEQEACPHENLLTEPPGPISLGPWPWRTCADCGWHRVWVGLTREADPRESKDPATYIDGWQVIPIGESGKEVAISNRPLVDLAKARGENQPEAYNAVVPIEVIHAIDQGFY